jgi:transcription elongation GreA/GreB family factor
MIAPTNTSILSAQDTFEFTKNLDVALRTVDIKKLKEAFEKSSLLSHPETKDFLSQGTATFKRFNNLEERIELLNVEDRSTRCSACNLGKTVRAYDIQYRKQESTIFVEYKSSYAVNLEIVNSELYDFSWCNFYLNKQEMKELTEI